MNPDRKGTFFHQAILNNFFDETFRRQFIDRDETNLSPLQKQVLKRFFVRRESVVEIAEHLKLKVEEVCQVLESGVARVRQADQRALQNFNSNIRPRIPSCEECGRKIKPPYRDVLCSSCIGSAQSLNFTIPPSRLNSEAS